jgi:mono/diheme cytochrome c family protein
MSSRRIWRAALLSVLLLVLAATAWLASQRFGHALPALDAPLPAAPVDQQARGAYLARFGHCAGCHTARGGAEWAGGRPIATPFGTVFSANLSPDPATGLGRWSQAAFVRALRTGRSADGRLLVPACPYPNFALVTETDAGDLYAYLRSQPPVQQAQPVHQLRFPYGTQAALAVWRGLFFHPPASAGGGPDPVLQRGAYLVGGLGHCNACHGQRNAWGATDGPLDLRGGALAGQGWWAPALDLPHEAGLAGWSLDEIVSLLKTGQSARGSVAGPMAMVVKDSTQYLSDADALAVAATLRDLPQRSAMPRARQAAAPDPQQLALGARVYENSCAGCHGAQGAGHPAGMPALAGNRAVLLEPPVNVLHVVLAGAFAPSTATHPQPHGMPPFATTLSDAEIAAVVTYIRNAWGQVASPVSALDVNRLRGGTP